MSTKSESPSPPGYSKYAVPRSVSEGYVEILLPDWLVVELVAKREERTRRAQAEYMASEQRRLELERQPRAVPSPAASSVPSDHAAFIRAFERGVARRRRTRAHQVLQATELLRVIARISTLRDKENQKREMELANKLVSAGAMRDIANPAFKPCRWKASLSYLRQAHPHFRAVTDLVAHRVALSTESRRPLRIPPIHIWGEPGLGKTFYANDLATALGAPLRRQSMENAQTTSLLLGTERHWSTATPGLIFEQICLGEFANPVFLIDELDKAPRNSSYDPLAPLHSLLEPVTARSVRDAALDIEFDASLATYIATSNRPEVVPESLRSRFREFHILPPSGAQALQMARLVATAATEQLEIPGFAAPSPRLCRELAHLTPREIHQAVQDAVAEALNAGRRQLTMSDFPAEIMGLEADRRRLQ